jgi:hypothetical protein
MRSVVIRFGWPVIDAGRLLTPWSGRLCTIIHTLKPAGIHRNWPEPAVTAVLSRSPPEARRDSGMRYQTRPHGPGPRSDRACCSPSPAS